MPFLKLLILMFKISWFKACFPLHEGRYDQDGPQGEKSDRRLLFLEWAHWRNFYKEQPLWLIKRYFGDKIGLYFAWLGFYNKMLVFPALFGVFVFLYGVITVNMPRYNISGNLDGRSSRLLFKISIFKVMKYVTRQVLAPKFSVLNVHCIVNSGKHTKTLLN